MSCNICLEDNADKECNKCSFVAHEECILKWFKQVNDNKCPHCKTAESWEIEYPNYDLARGSYLPNYDDDNSIRRRLLIIPFENYTSRESRESFTPESFTLESRDLIQASLDIVTIGLNSLNSHEYRLQQRYNEKEKKRLFTSIVHKYRNRTNQRRLIYN